MTHPVPYTAGAVQRLQSSWELSSLERRTRFRLATVQAESFVQQAKIDEVQHLVREGMSGSALLRGWANTLSGGDPLLAEEMRYFAELGRLGVGEIIADTIDSFCRESRS